MSSRASASRLEVYDARDVQRGAAHGPCQQKPQHVALKMWQETLQTEDASQQRGYTLLSSPRLKVVDSEPTVVTLSSNTRQAAHQGQL